MHPSDNSEPNFLNVCQTIQANWPAELWDKKNVMVAVSGGPDSVLLLRVLSRIHKRRADTGELIVCHVDHSVRKTSAADAEFVARLAEQHSLKFVSEFLDPIHSDSKSTSEDAMRQARYEQFMKMADACGARYLATGHNQSDQVETALFRLFRGTGFHGLRGIPFLRVQGAVTIVRPLLQVPRQMILAALEEIKQPFCTDPTNQTSNYTRNFLRNDVLPRLRERFFCLGRFGPEVDTAGCGIRAIPGIGSRNVFRCCGRHQRSGTENHQVQIGKRTRHRHSAATDPDLARPWLAPPGHESRMVETTE